MRSPFRSVALVLLGLAVASGVAASRPRHPLRRDFESACDRVICALCANDWGAFAKDASSRIVCGGFLYSGRPPRFGAPNQTTRSISTDRPLGSLDRAAFVRFGEWVRRSRDNFPAGEGIWYGRSAQGSVIVGKIANNSEWRIELAEDQGRWKVVRLAVEAR